HWDEVVGNATPSIVFSDSIEPSRAIDTNVSWCDAVGRTTQKPSSGAATAAAQGLVTNDGVPTMTVDTGSSAGPSNSKKLARTGSRPFQATASTVPSDWASASIQGPPPPSGSLRST